MTFADIVDLWLALPRPDTDIPFGDSVAMKNFHETLMLPNQRGWFKACHAWVAGGPGPDQFPELDEILKSLSPFQANVAQAHLECARLAQAPLNELFNHRLAFTAAHFGLCKDS